MPEFERKWKILLMHAAIFLTVFFGGYVFFLTSMPWTGVDVAVVEKIAKEHGREAKAPFIDPGEAICCSSSS